MSIYGEIRAEHPLTEKYHIEIKDEKFIREGKEIYRVGKVYRRCMDKKTGNLLWNKLLKENHAKVLYDVKDSAISE